MARSAVLVGRTTSDLVNNALVIVIMMVTGLIVGWRIHSSPLEALAGVGLLLLFAYAFSWAMAWIGLLVRSPEVFNNASFIFIFPITYIANTFVQSERLPSGLRHVAEWNPVSAVTLAARELFGNTSPLQTPPDVWPLRHPVLASLGWVVIFLLIFVPLANYQYKRAVAR
jgi:ABC-type polysaccharide/polyol phosphate export permease